MKTNRTAAAIAGTLLLAFTGVAAAQAKADFGKREYDSNCVVCHGKLGKGDGPYVGFVSDTKGAVDITTLMKKNGGVFPILKVTETIDGRHAVKAHGPRDMPIWGAEYLAKAKDAAAYADSPFDTDAYIHFRVYALAEYVYRLQVK